MLALLHLLGQNKSHLKGTVTLHFWPPVWMCTPETTSSRSQYNKQSRVSLWCSFTWVLLPSQAQLHSLHPVQETNQPLVWLCGALKECNILMNKWILEFRASTPFISSDAAGKLRTDCCYFITCRKVKHDCTPQKYRNMSSMLHTENTIMHTQRQHCLLYTQCLCSMYLIIYTPLTDSFFASIYQTLAYRSSSKPQEINPRLMEMRNPWLPCVTVC